MNHKEDCIFIFKRGSDLYEDLNKKTKEKINKGTELLEQHSSDYLLFLKINKYFKILNDMFLFNIISNTKYYNKICASLENEQIADLEINFPNTKDDIYRLCFEYPDAIDLIKDDIFNIQDIEDFKGLLILNKINPMLYYSTIESDDSMDKILYFEQNAAELYDILTNIINKMTKTYIELLKK